MLGLVNGFVALDPGIQALLSTLFTFVVGFLILQVAALSPALAEYLGQYKVGIVTWITGLVVNLIQNELNQIPPTWEGVATLVMKLIVEVAAVLLALNVLKKKGYRGLQS